VAYRLRDALLNVRKQTFKSASFFVILIFMALEVLYRKYRPDSFESVLGQESIVKSLSNSLKSGRISHAYLFSGSRGTGKTSMARIVARALGCSDNDLHEMDAASNRGIDDVRALREAVRARPFDSTHSVYIIDEAHMLTKDAFNALLKTLEEPPSHVVFILATTEVEKLPETVVSRCEVHTFKKPTLEILKKMIFNVAQSENIEFEAQSIELIALVGDGSFRDTHAALQKVLSGTPSSGSKKISNEYVESILGAPKRALVNEYLEAIVFRNAQKGISAVRKASQENLDMKMFLDLVLRKFRAALLIRIDPEERGFIKQAFSEEDFLFLEKIALDMKNTLSSKTLLSLLDAYQKVSRFHIPELALELLLINIIAEEKQ